MKVVNTSDADIVAAVPAPDVTASSPGTRWLEKSSKAPAAKTVFDSSQIPGEIIDLMVVNTDDAEGQPELRQGAGRRLVRDAWRS